MEIQVKLMALGMATIVCFSVLGQCDDSESRQARESTPQQATETAAKIRRVRSYCGAITVLTDYSKYSDELRHVFGDPVSIEKDPQIIIIAQKLSFDDERKIACVYALKSAKNVFGFGNDEMVGREFDIDEYEILSKNGIVLGRFLKAKISSLKK